MTDKSYYSEIGGDVKGLIGDGEFKGIAGDISGGVINQYIITQKSGVEIQAQTLITGSPYLGLRKFEVDDKDRFFGRDNWIIELTDYLKQKNVLLLLGASGSGKSSLVQAGLIPKLKDNLGANKLVNLTFVPDVNPFESFYGCLLANRYKQSQAKLAQSVQEDTLIKVVEGLKNNSDLWFIFIDQFEELFTRTPKTERDIFIKSLVNLIEKNDSWVKIVMTMRADFLDKLSPYPSLGKIHDQYSKMLTDMDESELRLAIAEPAARNGVIFEKGLINQIIADFYEQAGSLPLLQYTLDLLWQKNHIQERILNIKIYQEIGGVTGALEKQADKIYSQFNEQQRKAAEEIFLELISLEGEKAVSRRANKSSFEQEEMQREVLYQLIDNRLLVSKGEDGKATVEVAHEELLRCWKVLQDLIREKEEIIVLRSRLYADAKQWDDLQKQDAVKASSELWGGSKLAKIVEFQKNNSLPNLEAVAIEFIKASISQAERQKNEKIRTARIITAGSLVAVVISTGFGLMAWKQTQQAELNLANARGFSSLSLFDRGKELEAFVEAIKAGKTLQKQQASDTKVTNALQELLNRKSERNRLEGHGRYVHSVNFSPNGKTLVSGSDDKTIKLWNVETGQKLHTFEGHGGPVYSVNFSPDEGKTLVSGSDDKTIKLWNVETGQEIRTLKEHGGTVYSVNFSPDGKTLVSGSDDKTIKLWNVETGKEIRTLKGHKGPVYSVNFSRNGKTLVSGSGDKTIILWDVETGEKLHTFEGHNGPVYSVNFSHDGKTLVSGSGDKTIKLWNVEKPQEIRTLKGHNSRVRSVNFSPNGKTLVSGSWDNTIKLWNESTGQEILTLKGHEGPVWSVNFSPDEGKTLVSGSDDGTIKLWNVEIVQTLKGHDDLVNSVEFSPDEGKTLVSSSDDGTIKLWDVKTGEEIRTLKGNDYPVRSVNFSPDGNTLVSGSDDKTIILWDVKTGKKIHTFEEHNGLVRSVNFSPNGETLVSGSWDGTIKLWDVEKRQKIHTFEVHHRVRSVNFSPDGKTLVSGSNDKTIKLWDVKTGKEIHTSYAFKGHEGPVRSVNFSPNGETLVSGSYDKTIKLWDVKTGKEIHTFEGHDGPVRSVNFSPNGKTLVSGSDDKTIKLWNVEKRQEIRTLHGHNSRVRSVNFSPNGKTLVSGSWDNTIKLWKVETDSNLLNLDALMGRSCDWVRAYLHNPNSGVREEDRGLCDGIGGKSSVSGF
ncbi:MAG: WD40 repeat domain-containing protein [Microcystis sp. 49638_E5]|jgi:WD40 repeat protein/energy-coupling factor transporter ATP-binding protein EcfA2|uniref:WD40 repeat domain-containing protein n=1 Tax=unclassified Microcystis TaxID=2643300 RepID=UPI0022BFD0CD|nr:MULTISPECIES: WD40 repeat domain-containing protein [unclassified Microcystis]MCE2668650.1 WD40 repeat domain-containing protein [Microcystis sp. 49638_E5]MCZ8058363.1 WD40 repeat domain-containing protein [Microcystis sp. LE19-12.2C]MDJ0584300.1 WD40 repeat domain-containing protein [Microcystis sp. M49636_WE2]